MRIRKIAGQEPIVKTSTREVYDQYVSLDWSEATMAVATMRPGDVNPRVWEARSDVAFAVRQPGIIYAGTPETRPEHVSEAIQYRSLDRNLVAWLRFVPHLNPPLLREEQRIRIVKIGLEIRSATLNDYPVVRAMKLPIISPSPSFSSVRSR